MCVHQLDQLHRQVGRTVGMAISAEDKMYETVIPYLHARNQERSAVHEASGSALRRGGNGEHVDNGPPGGKAMQSVDECASYRAVQGRRAIGGGNGGGNGIDAHVVGTPDADGRPVTECTDKLRESIDCVTHSNGKGDEDGASVLAAMRICGKRKRGTRRDLP